MLTYTIIAFTLISPILAKPFWISAELDAIQWKDGCLTTALCADPRLQIVKELLPLAERASVSWPVSDVNRKPEQPFISFWPAGRIEDVTISAQVIGVDRTYGFPRVCDQTPTIRIFQASEIAIIQEFEDVPVPAAENKTIQIKGKCFDATITITKHEDRCPWCPDPRDVEVLERDTNELSGVEVSHQASALASGFQSIVGLIYGNRGSDVESMQVGIMLLSLFALIMTACFAIVLVFYIKSRRVYQQQENAKKNRNNININVQPKLIPYQHESRYDMPWETNTIANQKRSYFTSPSTSSSTTSSSDKGYCTYRIPPPPSFAPPM